LTSGATADGGGRPDALKGPAMTDDALAARIERIAADHPGFDHLVLFDLGPDGHLLLDARTRPPTVAAPPDPSRAPADGVDATIAVSEADLRALVDGGLSPTIAYMTGRLKVSGPLDVAMKLGRMLGEDA